MIGNDISAKRNADGRLELFALGGDRAAYHIWQTAANGTWTGSWSSLGYPQLPPPPPPPPPPVAIDYFNAAPDYGYITIGSSATLSWQISNAPADTVVSLRGREAGFGNDIVLNKAHVPWKGSQTVTPSHDTTYTLTAHNSKGTSSRDTLVTVYYPPNPPPGSVFYFKMTNPQSGATPCFTIAVYAKDEMTAK